MSSVDGDDVVWDEQKEEERLRSMEREWTDINNGEIDYYAVLNVGKTASTDTIREAYKRLSRLFHPDRHQSAEKREWAQRQFYRIQRAYEILTDPSRRAAYDELGEKGLRTGMAVGYKMQSVKDLRDMFEREARMKKMEEVEHWVQSNSNTTVSLSTVAVTSPAVVKALEKARVPQGQVLKVEVRKLDMKHSFSANITDNLTATASGYMVTRNGRGGGNVVGTLKRTIGPQSWVQLSMPVLPPYKITAESMYHPTSESFCTSEVTMHTVNLATPPSVNVTMGRMITENNTGFLTIRTGNQYAFGPFWENSPTRISPKKSKEDKTQGKIPRYIVPRDQSGVSIGVVGKYNDNTELTASVTAGIQNSQLSLNCVHNIDNHFSVSAGIKLIGIGAPIPDDVQYRMDVGDDIIDARPTGLQGLGEIETNIEITGEIDQWTKIGWGVGFGLLSGVKATISLQRLGHTIRLPILLSPLLEPEVVLCSAILPVALAFGLHYTVLKPRRRRMIEQRMDELKEEQRYQLFQQKRHATEAVRLMAPSVERMREKAKQNGGLVIEAAYYGDLPFGIAEQDSNAIASALELFKASKNALEASDEPCACNVALALQALVTDNQLVITGSGSKRFLPGFYDPAFGVKKRLYIKYTFKGRAHEVVVNDNQPLAIPMRAHCIEQ